MAADDFQPILGRIRSGSGAKNQRYLNRVVRSLKRAGHSRPGGGRSSFSGGRSGRGYSSAAAQYAHSFQPGRRRVIIKARFTRFRNGNIGAARAHLRYIQRDGVTREGEPGELYGPDTDHADGKAFLSEAEGDRHQFRFIVAPEDSAQMEDLKPFIRDLMSQAEKDLGTKLDWVAVDHFNTGHPHSHIIVRGKDDLGEDLVIARDYLSHGLREQACDLVTLELGPETQHEVDQKIAREVQSERFTRIDRSLMKDAELGILSVSSSPKLDPLWHSHRMGRLRKLENMGLAEELKPGVWKLADRMEIVLRDLGQRNDIMKNMQRVLKDAGIDRVASDYSVFDATKSGLKITGKVVAIGLSNELQDHHYVVVDGTDGKLHYAEIGKPNKYDPPSKDMVVTLRSQNPGEKQFTSKQISACVLIESHAPFVELANADGATWLDGKLLSKEPPEFSNEGFGAEANQALRLRQQWLVQENLMTEQNGQLIACRKLLEKLQHREIGRMAKQLEKELGLSFRRPEGRERFDWRISKTMNMISGRCAVMHKGKEFSLVPWRQAMQMHKGKGFGIDSVRGISR